MASPPRIPRSGRVARRNRQGQPLLLQRTGTEKTVSLNSRRKAAPSPSLSRASTVPENSLNVNQQRRRLKTQRSFENHKRVASTNDASSSTLLQKISDTATLLGLTPDSLTPPPPKEDPVLADLKLFQYSQQDIESILRDQEAFQTLKDSLRKRSCVTNAYLKLNLHYYVHHVKEVREARYHYYQDTNSIRRDETIHNDSERNEDEDHHQQHAPAATPA